MSLNSIVESNKAKLCDCTDPNKSLLNKLNNFGIITDGMRSSLVTYKKIRLCTFKKLILIF
jgi:hypothetical protein